MHTITSSAIFPSVWFWVKIVFFWLEWLLDILKLPYLLLIYACIQNAMLLNADRNIHFIYVAISKQKQSEAHRDLFYQIANPLNFNCEQTKFVQREREFFCTNFMIATWFWTTQEPISNRIKLQKIKQHRLKSWKFENSKTLTHTRKKSITCIVFTFRQKSKSRLKWHCPLKKCVSYIERYKISHR